MDDLCLSIISRQTRRFVLFCEFIVVLAKKVSRTEPEEETNNKKWSVKQVERDRALSDPLKLDQ